MNIFIREMKAHRRSLIIWCVGMLFMVSAGMAKYSGAAASEQSVNNLVAQLPKAVQAIIGVGYFDLSKAMGYYGMLFLYLAVMASVHAAMLGAGIITEEEVDKTSEFLFAKPVSRNRIITSKLLAALTNILILNLITLASSIIMVGYFSKGEYINEDIVTLMIGMFILQLIFLFIGTGLAAMGKQPKRAASIANVILLTAFVLSVAIDLNDNLGALKYVTPFKYYDAKDLLNTGFNPVFVILSAVIVTSLLGLTYVCYRKRDLNV